MNEKASKSSIPGKSICIPASPPVDVEDFIPIIDHSHFQKLKHRKQLGVNFLVFPGAVHTRFEHSVGVLGLTQRLCRIHGLSVDETRDLCAFALLHDIGHGPFSHQIEPIIGGSHHRRGTECLHDMAPELVSCGLDPARIVALLAEEDPLGQFVDDRNLGTDKLDYLIRDALHIGFSGSPDVERLQFFSVIDDGVLAIEEKFTEDIKQVQKFYSYLHQHGYLNKTALSIQRIFQRAVQEELAEGHTDPGVLWDMTDYELMWWLRQGCNALAGRLLDMLESRDFHRSVVVIKPARYGFVERRSDKTLLVREWSRDKIRRFSDAYSDCSALMQLENDLAAEMGFAPGDVLFAAMPYFDKLVPRDVRIYSRRQGESFWLFEKDRDHLQSLKGDYLRTFSIRVIVPHSQRQAALGNADAILRFLDERLPEE